MSSAAGLPWVISSGDRLDSNNLLDGYTRRAQTRLMRMLRPRFISFCGALLVRGALLFSIFSSAVPAMQAAVLPSSSVSSQSYGAALIFYAEPQVSDSLWPLLFQTLRADLSTSADDMPSGVVLDKEPV